MVLVGLCAVSVWVVPMCLVRYDNCVWCVFVVFDLMDGCTRCETVTGRCAEVSLVFMAMAKCRCSLCSVLQEVG